jgi:hypothetical protein
MANILSATSVTGCDDAGLKSKSMKGIMSIIERRLKSTNNTMQILASTNDRIKGFKYEKKRQKIFI